MGFTGDDSRNIVFIGINDSLNLGLVDGVFSCMFATADMDLWQGALSTVDTPMLSSGSTIRALWKNGPFASANIGTVTLELNDVDTVMVLTIVGTGLTSREESITFAQDDSMAWRWNHVSDAGAITWRGIFISCNVP